MKQKFLIRTVTGLASLVVSLFLLVPTTVRAQELQNEAAGPAHIYPYVPCRTDGKCPVYRFYDTIEKKHWYTASLAEKKDLENNLTWKTEGIEFYANKTQVSNTYPVYHLRNINTGDALYTIVPDEKNKLIATGRWENKGIAYYAYVEDLGALYKPVYRLWNSNLRRHTLVSNTTELNMLLNSGWTRDVTAFYALSDNTCASNGLCPVYRLRKNTGHYLITTTYNEAFNLVKGGAWQYESTLYWGAKNQVGTTKPIYRLFSSTGDHLFTASQIERNQLISAGWTDEGTGLYAYTSEDVPGTVAVHRLWNTSSNIHLYTTSLVEKSNLISAGWRDEGRAFYVPTSDNFNIK